MTVKRRKLTPPIEEERKSRIKRAKARRDEGIARAEAGADDEWKVVALETLHEYLQSHRTFFCDDLWLETKLPRPREARALGPVILNAARRGWMVKSEDYRPSTASNMTPKPVWISRIFRSR